MLPRIPLGAGGKGVDDCKEELGDSFSNWCPDEVVKQELVTLGWQEEANWTREELGERMGK